MTGQQKKKKKKKKKNLINQRNVTYVNLSKLTPQRRPTKAHYLTLN